VRFPPFLSLTPLFSYVTWAKVHQDYELADRIHFARSIINSRKRSDESIPRAIAIADEAVGHVDRLAPLA
jgi:hypothetical protein